MYSSITPFKEESIEVVANIWLETNISAHSFIPEAFWLSHYEEVKRLLPEASLFVYSEGEKIVGFIGIIEEKYIAGLFVLEKYQSRGIGRELLGFCKKNYPFLELRVYKQNKKAVSFYQREGFQVVEDQVDPLTGQKEYKMEWKKA